VSGTVALRTALIWHDEVMSDVVSEKPRKITLGKFGRPTFVTPDVGLPAGFAIVRPGNRGYLLTLGEKMRGTICIDGKEQEVEEFVRSGDGAKQGSFRATPISGRDWGVIDLDESGTTKLFFQFVPIAEEAPVFFTPKVIMAGIGGYLLSALVGTWLWYWLAGWEIEEAAFAGVGIASLALAKAAIIHWFWKQDGETKASYAVSLALHGALLYTTFALYTGEDPFAWPGPRSMTGNYLATRLEPEPPPEPVKNAPTVAKEKTAAAPKSDSKEKKNTATKGDEGKSGGEGEERASLKDSKDDHNVAAPQILLNTPQARKELEFVRSNTPTGLAKFRNAEFTQTGYAGKGKGTGSGVGDELAGTGTKTDGKGKGPGGGGDAVGDFTTSGKVQGGTERKGGNCVGEGCKGNGPREVKVAIATGTGDFGGYTEDEINRVVKARAGVFRACYQKELNRSPGLGGKLVVRFKIGSDGAVQTAANAGGSTLSHDAVEQCVKSNVMRLKFPPKGAIANVTYPFVFSQGG
jgi:hypothetical protein